MVPEADRKNNYNFLEVVELFILVIKNEMTSRHWGEESIHIVEYWSCARTADDPVLVILINHKYEGLEVFKSPKANWAIAVNAV